MARRTREDDGTPACVDDLRALASGKKKIRDVSTEARILVIEIQHVLEQPKAKRQAPARLYLERYTAIAIAIDKQRGALVDLIAKRYGLGRASAERVAADPAGPCGALWRMLDGAIEEAERLGAQAQLSIGQGDVQRDRLYLELHRLGLAPEEIADLLAAVDGVDLATGARGRIRGLAEYLDRAGGWDADDGRGRLAAAVAAAIKRARP